MDTKEIAEVQTYRAGYDQGFIDGETHINAGLSFVMDKLDLPESLEADEDYDTIRNMAKRIKELESKIELAVEKLLLMLNTQDT